MNAIPHTLTDLIGGTPMLKLGHIMKNQKPEGGADRQDRGQESRRQREGTASPKP